MAGIRMSGMVSGMDTESLVQGLVEAQKIKNKRTSDKSANLTFKQDKWKELNTKLYSLYKNQLEKLTRVGNYSAKKVTSTDEKNVAVSGNSSAIEGNHKLEVLDVASAQYLTGAKITGAGGAKITDTAKTKLEDLGVAVNSTYTVTAGGTTKTLTVTDETTMDDFTKFLGSAGLNASFDKEQGRFFISSKATGTDNAFSITTDDSTNDSISKLGLEVSANGATLKAASNSKIKLNGATLESSSNTYNVNGLTIEAKGKTTGEVDINVVKDPQNTYDMIKDFVKSYNEIIKEMNTLYDAPSSKGYAPLSSDEKAAMSDKEVELWEAKITDSILRRDTKLGTLNQAMKTSAMTAVEVNGKTYSLASFGIATSSDYSEKGLLHIAGDKDDPTTADATDKLLKALQDDPDLVMNVVKGVADNMYSLMQDKMQSIPNVSSALTFYDDKSMNEMQTKYKKEMAVLETKLLEMENKYYKQFSAMETQLSKLQSQSNSLLSMLG